MSFILIIGMVAGAAIGWFAAKNRILTADPVLAAIVGGLGGLLGGLALKIILPVALAVLVGLAGALILLALYNASTNSRR